MDGCVQTLIILETTILRVARSGVWRGVQEKKG